VGLAVQQVAIVLLNALTLAALYFVVASGLTLIFGLMRIVNMAHGSLFLLGGYVGFSISDSSGSWVLGLLGGAIAAGAVGLALYQLLLARFQNQMLRQTLVSIGCAIVMADLMLAFWGAETYQIEPPALLDRVVRLPVAGGYSTLRLYVLAFAVIVGGLLWLLLNRTRLGMMIRAGVDDLQTLRALGVRVRLVFPVTAFLAGALAGLAGVVFGTALSISPGEDMHFLLTSLVVVIAGGMGSIPGAALGAILVGLAEQFGVFYLPTYSVMLTFGLMAAVLAFRPEGLFGVKA
jgi:branched-chain amino acid transport system permease protein